MRCGSKKAIESRAVSPRISKIIFKQGYPRQNQFPSGNNLQGECLYRWKSTAGWNVSIGHSTDTANCASSFSCLSQGRFRFPRKPVPPPPPLRRRRRRPRASRGEQTSEDKVRARPATIFTLDTQIYLAPILNLDRSPLSPLKRIPPRDLFFDRLSRNFCILLGRRKEEFGVYPLFERFFFFFVSFLSFSRIGIGIDGMIITVRRRRTIFSF